MHHLDIFDSVTSSSNVNLWPVTMRSSRFSEVIPNPYQKPGVIGIDLCFPDLGLLKAHLLNPTCLLLVFVLLSYVHHSQPPLPWFRGKWEDCYGKWFYDLEWYLEKYSSSINTQIQDMPGISNSIYVCVFGEISVNSKQPSKLFHLKLVMNFVFFPVGWDGFSSSFFLCLLISGLLCCPI